MTTLDVFEPKATYLASEKGFNDYCKGCKGLVSKEGTPSHLFPLRVHCAQARCTAATRVKGDRLQRVASATCVGAER